MSDPELSNPAFADAEAAERYDAPAADATTATEFTSEASTPTPVDSSLTEKVSGPVRPVVEAQVVHRLTTADGAVIDVGRTASGQLVQNEISPPQWQPGVQLHMLPNGLVRSVVQMPPHLHGHWARGIANLHEQSQYIEDPNTYDPQDTDPYSATGYPGKPATSGYGVGNEQMDDQPLASRTGVAVDDQPTTEWAAGEGASIDWAAHGERAAKFLRVGGEKFSHLSRSRQAKWIAGFIAVAYAVDLLGTNVIAAGHTMGWDPIKWKAHSHHVHFVPIWDPLAGIGL